MANDGGRKSTNPFSSMLGDLASSVLKGGNSVGPKNDNLDAKLLSKSPADGWDKIRLEWEQSCTTDEERNFRSLVEQGRIASPLNQIRLFDSSQTPDDIRVTFYRDSASWCPYCQKVWFALEEKQIPYRVEKINMSCYGDKPRDFLTRIQPNGQIPVAVIDGRLYGQSNDILAALEQEFPNHTSLQPSAENVSRARSLLQLEQALAGAWLGWLRSKGNKGAKRNFEQTIAAVEQALSDNDNSNNNNNNNKGPFFMGPRVTIVDVQFLSFLERACASLLYFKGYQIRGNQKTFPAINRWFDALEERPSYQLTKSDYYTHAWDLPPQLGGCGEEPEGEPYRRKINGEDASWHLPLDKDGDDDDVEPEWKFCGSSEEEHKREAVERLSYNHQAIVAFAARGAGSNGMPPVLAPLADPNAISNEAVMVGVDVVLQIVALALLRSSSSSTTTDEELETSLANVRDEINDSSSSSSYMTEGLLPSLRYLRDRIGVPRDMRYPAARQLRAHLNWAMDILQQK
eukprot:CAMPEP_0178931622 /NCGR_PEP_ID=MMETSP0786-20121207/22026_1 /TAXON_ID=186022 /ORGANISM="Thalassionema frauenfeldii, Strain CCMP 1798" /LENGTH=514 /DNA_ID=CAMNT_0020608547 /DNA_START=162 /DNA_END=1703 /DNA_ORIENTATION=+